MLLQHENGKRTMPRGKKAVPVGESKRQKFVRLAKVRTIKAAMAIDSIGKLGGAGYERTEADAVTIRGVLQTRLDAALARLAPGPAKMEKPTIEVNL